MRSIIFKTVTSVLAALSLYACSPSAVSKSTLNQQVQNVNAALQDGSLKQSVGVSTSSNQNVIGIEGVVEFPNAQGYLTFSVTRNDDRTLFMTLRFDPAQGDWTDYVALKDGRCFQAATLRAQCDDVDSSKWQAVFAKIAAIAKEKNL